MHLNYASAVIEQLNNAQLEDLVQKGGWLMDVNRHSSLAGWIFHCFIKVLQPGTTHINTFTAKTTEKNLKTAIESDVLLKTRLFGAFWSLTTDEHS